MKTLFQVCEIATGPFFLFIVSRFVPFCWRGDGGGGATGERLEELLFTEQMLQAMDYWNSKHHLHGCCERFALGHEWAFLDMCRSQIFKYQD